jgi:hypothetical integral membrane protein (TIGR02206 family)
MVAVTAAGAWLRGRAAEERVRRVLAVLLALFVVPLQVRQWWPGEFDLRSSLPLQICDISWVVAVWALWTRDRRASALLYFWGLTLTVQAVVTPTLGQDFPDPEYVLFWGMHLLTIWAAVLLTFGLRVRPDWAGYRFAVACTVAWLVVVMVFNTVAGTNYGHLARKPAVASLLDVLGPWPAYIAAEAVIVLAGWALITWPWVRLERRERSAQPSSP